MFLQSLIEITRLYYIIFYFHEKNKIFKLNLNFEDYVRLFTNAVN